MSIIKIRHSFQTSTVQKWSVGIGPILFVLCVLLSSSLLLKGVYCESSSWALATDGLENSVRNGTAWIIGETKRLPNKYFRIQNQQSLKFLTVVKNGEKAQASVQLEEKPVESESQVWVVHSTLGFPFRNGSFSPIYEISLTTTTSSSGSHRSSKTSVKILNNLRTWRLQLEEGAGGQHETFVMYRPFNQSCLVETPNASEGKRLSLENCESTTTGSKFWNFIPVSQRWTNHELDRQEITDTDFDTSSKEF